MKKSKITEARNVSATMRNLLDGCGDKKIIRRNSTVHVEENNFDLKKMLMIMRIKKHVKTFVNKLSRNSCERKPFQFIIQSKDTINENRYCQLKGFQLSDGVESIILFFDIIMSLILFVISGFQGFLVDFASRDGSNSIIVVLKCICLCVFCLRFIIDIGQVEIIEGKLYQYVADIIQYNKFNLVYNLLCITIVILTLALPSLQVIGVIQFFFEVLKMPILYDNLKIIEGAYLDSPRRKHIWNLIKITIFNILFAHFLACMLLSLVYLDSTPDKSKNWLVKYGIANISWSSTYFYAYYWATTMMLSIGFGDITPMNENEAFSIAFLQVFSVIVLAINIGIIGQVVISIIKSGEVIAAKIGMIRRMSKKDEISIQLQKRMEHYIVQKVNINETKEDLERLKLLQQFPVDLKREYETQANRKIFINLPFLSNLRLHTIVTLIEEFNAKIYSSEEYILKSHKGSLNICIIKRGTVNFNYFKPNSSLNGSLVEVHQVNDEKHSMLINLNILFRTDPINYDIMAENYIFALEINYNRFLQVLKYSQIDTEYYHLLKDKDAFNQNPFQTFPCQYCKGEYHTKFACQRLHFTPYKSLVICKHERNSKRNQRIHFHRNINLDKNHCYLLRKSFFKLYQEEIGLFQYNQKKLKKGKNHLKKVKPLKSITFSVFQEFFMHKNEVFEREEDIFVDEAQNFNYYYPSHNADNLKNSSLKKKTMKNREQKSSEGTTPSAGREIFIEKPPLLQENDGPD